MAEFDRDEELIESARRGDDLAFERLMRLHSDSIRRLRTRFFRDQSTVDGLAPETFVKVYFGLVSFRNESPFVYRLKRIAVRLCLDEMRNRKSPGGPGGGYRFDLERPRMESEGPARSSTGAPEITGHAPPAGSNDRDFTLRGRL